MIEYFIKEKGVFVFLEDIVDLVIRIINGEYIN